MNYRENAYKEPKVPMDTRWIWRVLGVLSAVAAFGFAAGSGVECARWNRLHPAPPDVTECTDSEEIVSFAESTRHCAPGAHLTILPMADTTKVLTLCSCAATTPKPFVDAGYDAAQESTP